MAVIYKVTVFSMTCLPHVFFLRILTQNDPVFCFLWYLWVKKNS
jgi:hypothetical protein